MTKSEAKLKAHLSRVFEVGEHDRSVGEAGGAESEGARTSKDLEEMLWSLLVETFGHRTTVELLGFEFHAFEDHLRERAKRKEASQLRREEISREALESSKCTMF